MIVCCKLYRFLCYFMHIVLALVNDRIFGPLFRVCNIGASTTGSLVSHDILVSYAGYTKPTFPNCNYILL